MNNMFATLICLASLLIFSNCSNDDSPNPPTISSITPESGVCKDTITVSGSGFSSVKNGNRVTLSGTSAMVVSQNETLLQFIVPDAATSGPISVTINNIEVISDQVFEVLIDNPVVDPLSVNVGSPGDILTITGSEFPDSKEGVTILFNGIPGIVISQSNTSIDVIIPNSTTGKVIALLNCSTLVLSPDFQVNIDMAYELDNLIATDSNIPSLAMTVIKNGEIVFSHGAGFYDAQSKVADGNTFYIGSSIAKLIVAVAIMQQAELGKLDIDQDVGDYLGFEVRNPNFPNTIITSRMLMQHAASLSNPVPGEVDNQFFATLPADSIVQLFPSIAQAIDPNSSIYNSSIWINSEPGTSHKNSNFGMTLLGYLAEKLSGKHLNDYTKDHIFTPLGMNSTSFYYPDIDPSSVAVTYGNNGIPLSDPFNLYWYPAGMLYTNGNEWVRFLSAIINGGSLNGNQILQSSSVDQMLDVMTPANNQLAYNSNIGLIWREAPANSGWIGHTGGGFVTHITELNETEKTGYILFCNAGGLGSIIGPGGSLNTVIHEWLDQQEN